MPSTDAQICGGCLTPWGALPPPHTFREGCMLRSPIGERLDAQERAQERPMDASAELYAKLDALNALWPEVEARLCRIGKVAASCPLPLARGECTLHFRRMDGAWRVLVDLGHPDALFMPIANANAEVRCAAAGRLGELEQAVRHAVGNNAALVDSAIEAVRAYLGAEG